jgi:hypothetical protein
MPRVGTLPKATRSQRPGEEGAVRRRPPAAAGRQRGVEARGRPQTRLGVERRSRGQTAPAARKGKRGPGTRLDPKLSEGPRPRQAEKDCPRAGPLDAPGASAHASASAVGKAPAQGQDVPAGRRLPRPLLPDTVGAAAQEPTSLRGRAHKAKADTRPWLRELDRCLEAALCRACWQALHKEAARGVEQGPADAYAGNLHDHSEAVGQRWKTPCSRAQLVRRGAMPNAHGTARPGGMPALEAKLVPRACAQRLTALSARMFSSAGTAIAADGGRGRRSAPSPWPAKTDGRAP